MRRWFRRRRAGSAPAHGRGSAASEDLAHLTEFARTRRGVEGFVEPRTTVTETTLLLVADDGEWTRRRMPDAARAHEFANRLGIPSYDAQVVGYPQRMRAWNSRRAAAEKQARSLGPTAPGEAG